MQDINHGAIEYFIVQSFKTNTTMVVSLLGKYVYNRWSLDACTEEHRNHKMYVLV